MIDYTREQKRAELEQKIKAMRLMDDNFMTTVLSDKACAELVIRIILDKDDIVVKHTRTQYPINSLKNHSVRLDVYAEDSEGTKYDIEIQRSDRGATPKRARYISSMIDADTLLSSEDYAELPETYVIFITGNDILGQNKPLYNIERTINGTSYRFNDGSHIIYVNSRIQDDTKLGKLMKDFTCVDPDGYTYKLLSDRAGYFKNSKEGLQTMCRIIEEIVEKEVADTKREAAINLLKSTKLSPEEISQVLKIDKDIVDELSKQIGN